jgi:hypothetical protein
MPKGILFVQSGPSHPDREDEYNNWYTKVHIPDVCAVDGVTGARRYKVSDPSQLASDAPGYCAVYDLDADDLNGVIGDIAARATDGRMSISDSMAMDPTPVMTIYELVD